MSELNIGTRLTPMLNEKLLGNQSSGATGIGSNLPKNIGGAGESSEDFLGALRSAVMETNTALVKSDKASVDFASGKANNLHDVMIAMEKADLSLRTLTAVRGKVLEAYQEIMRMQV